MKFEKLDLKKHDLGSVSELIYETDISTFNFFFHNKNVATEKIGKLILTGKNTLGCEGIHVLSGDNQVLGVLVSFQGNEIDKPRK